MQASPIPKLKGVNSASLTLPAESEETKAPLGKFQAGLLRVAGRPVSLFLFAAFLWCDRYAHGFTAIPGETREHCGDQIGYQIGQAV